jgi:phosphatidylglycerol lysyltransferase
MVPVNTSKIVDTFFYETVENLLKGYGFNSTSYLALESDKKHFLHQQISAVTAYAQFNRVAIAAGEPICPAPLIGTAISEFIDFAESNSLKPLFFEVTEPVIPYLHARGFKFLKLGEEPFIELDKFTLKGNKMANVRSSAATARKRGVTVREYFPQSAEASLINPQLEAISKQWLTTRGISELSFTLGTLSLDCPGERRYFIAEYGGEAIAPGAAQAIAFLTYTPIYRRQGVYLDLMRRLDSTPTGTMDLLLSESFRLLKDSGVKLATLGMSPLSNVRNSQIEQSKALAWFLDRFSVAGQGFYRFEPMHDFKRKFCPHFWESKYLAYCDLGIREIDAILRAILHQSLGKIVWDVLNQPITIKIGNFEFK